MKKLLLITATLLCIQNINAQTVTDIDGNVYNTVRIGNQVWMKENLKTTHYSDGTAIPLVNTVASWAAPALSITSKAYCWYNDDITNKATYGALYTWTAAMNGTASTSANPSNVKGVCPTGWHLPSDAEWTQLTTFLGGESVAGGKLKETGTTHWGAPNTGATNETGFTALSAGGRFDDGTFASIENYGSWWSATEGSTDKAYSRFMFHNLSNADKGNDYKALGFSVRCLEDPIPDSARYFGQTRPGNTAVIFAPKFLSNTHPLELLRMAFSPDGKELYYSVYTDSFKIYFTKRENNMWSEPAEAPFSVNHNALSPSFSVDGKSLYFIYYNPTSYINEIYKVDRTPGGWNEPKILPSPINLTNDGDYAETPDSVAYIGSNRNNGNWDIWCIRRLSDSSFQAVSLGSNVNSNGDDSYPCVAPDGSYLIFSSTRGGGYGNQDLYICFNKGNNQLAAPINMERSGAKINAADSFQDYPSISSDGKFLFFRRANSDFSTTNVYWVSTHIIDTLKKIAMPTSSGLSRKIKQDVKLYPNPTKGIITLSFGTMTMQHSILEIFNAEGKRIIFKMYKNTTSATIDLTGYPKGMYLVRTTSGKQIDYQKICLE